MRIRLVATPDAHDPVVARSIMRMDQRVLPKEELVEVPGSYWWQAFPWMSSHPVAFAGLKLVDDGNAAFLSRAGVLPHYRGRGLQRALIEARVRYARRLGVASVITYTARDNWSSISSLIRTGFRVYTPEYTWGLDDGVYFMKEIHT